MKHAARISRISMLLAAFISSATVFAASGDMSVSEVLADNCRTVPLNFSITNYWDTNMDALSPFCDTPSITQNSINGSRKPQAFADGSSGVSHDANAILALNGTGAGSSKLGTAPGTQVNFGSFCSDSDPLFDAEPGDVVFSLRAWNNSCSFMNSSLPTIPVFGIDNKNKFVGDNRNHSGIQIGTRNWGLAIDYYSPGGAGTVLGGGNISYALPEFAGIIVALNTALISAGREVLTKATIKEVLDASSDEVYLEVNGFKGIYKESELNALLANPSNNTHYHGQIVDLSNAIAYALNKTPPPGEYTAAILIPILKLLLLDD